MVEGWGGGVAGLLLVGSLQTCGLDKNDICGQMFLDVCVCGASGFCYVSDRSGAARQGGERVCARARACVDESDRTISLPATSRKKGGPVLTFGR